MTEERDVMEVDVLFVGGGVASLSGAIHLSNLVRAHNEKNESNPLEEPMVAVLEKGGYVGAHSISGAVMNPESLKELIPDFLEKGAPVEAEVKKEVVCYLTKSGKITAPITPPPMNNHGYYVISMARMVEWLGTVVDECGIDVFPGFAGTEVLYDDGGKIIGVRTGDKGIDADGNKKANFEPGIDLQAKVTVFGEGSRGSLTKQLIEKHGLDKGQNPPNFNIGVKETWEVPEGNIELGTVVHTLGYPLKWDTYGGGFLYAMKDNLVTLGLMIGLEYHDPHLDPHTEFQKLKTHPYIAGILKGGTMRQYGAKTAPVGGYFSIPKLTMDGGMIIGDAANLFISQKIKGVHVAMKSGMLAAEAIFNGMIKDDLSEAQLATYQKALLDSSVGKELWKSRNFHQLFQNGLVEAMIKAPFQYALGGRIIKAKLETHPDHESLKTVEEVYKTEEPTDEQKGVMKFDGEKTFDKETDVYYSGATHEEQQPAHLKILDLDICYGKCTKEFQNPCTRFCPANVYEMEVNEETGERKMKLNFSNCVHCKTCDIKDPYQNINWVPPEGGGGPKYTTV